jgi:hypothetical protein
MAWRYRKLLANVGNVLQALLGEPDRGTDANVRAGEDGIERSGDLLSRSRMRNRIDRRVR